MKAVGRLVSEHMALEAAEEVATKARQAGAVKSVEYVLPAQARAAVVASKKTAHDKVLEASKAA